MMRFLSQPSSFRLCVLLLLPCGQFFSRTLRYCFLLLPSLPIDLTLHFMALAELQRSRADVASASEGSTGFTACCQPVFSLEEMNSLSLFFWIIRNTRYEKASWRFDHHWCSFYKLFHGNEWYRLSLWMLTYCCCPGLDESYFFPTFSYLFYTEDTSSSIDVPVHRHYGYYY